MSVALAFVQSPWGALVAQASELGITRFRFLNAGPFTSLNTTGTGRAMGHLRQLSQQFKEYLAGRRRTFDVPLDLRGTEFQMRVWQELCRIPYAETISYRDLARASGHPSAVRAVGQANRRNPILILVPCHRVIAADGSMGGYAWGQEVKRDLLTLERWGKRPSSGGADWVGG